MRNAGEVDASGGSGDEALHRRRTWFAKYRKAAARADYRDPEDVIEVPYTCPCCGYPTLAARNRLWYCAICWWEDDGQDDPRADEVFGGPNGIYSLSQSRQYFRQYGKYSPPNENARLAYPDEEGESELERESVRRMISTFEAMMTPQDDDARIALWEVVKECYATLDAEKRRKNDAS